MSLTVLLRLALVFVLVGASVTAPAAAEEPVCACCAGMNEGGTAQDGRCCSMAPAPADAHAVLPNLVSLATLSTLDLDADAYTAAAVMPPGPREAQGPFAGGRRILLLHVVLRI